MNKFISEVGSYLKEIPEIEKKADQLITYATEEGKRGKKITAQYWAAVVLLLA